MFSNDYLDNHVVNQIASGQALFCGRDFVTENSFCFVFHCFIKFMKPPSPIYGSNFLHRFGTNGAQKFVKKNKWKSDYPPVGRPEQCLQTI